MNTSYVANLQALPEHQKQLDMYGNWDVVTGRMFDLKEEQIISPAIVREDLEHFFGLKPEELLQRVDNLYYLCERMNSANNNSSAK